MIDTVNALFSSDCIDVKEIARAQSEMEDRLFAKHVEPYLFTNLFWLIQSDLIR